MDPAAGDFDSGIRDLLPDLERVYTDIHAHPELSMQETRTAWIAADGLRATGFDVTTGVGKTGVVGVLGNGDGPVIMLRADMDALPVHEDTGLAYASKETATDSTGKQVPVMHACGHDMHVTWLIGAATVLAQTGGTWKETLMPVFQPAEETGAGAQAMIDDGLMSRFPKPDAVLGQHVMVGPAGAIGGRTGVITSAADSLQIRLFGRGAQGSMPQAAIDPVVMAAATVLRLQMIVSRELAATDAAVVTIESLQAGTKENVIPDEAIIKLNVRTFDEGVRVRVLAAITRIVNAEAAASGAPKPPEITPIDRYSLVSNDPDATRRVVGSFRAHFPADGVREAGTTPASEDFGSFGVQWHAPSVFWFVGDRSRCVRQRQGIRPPQRASHQPQPAFCACVAPHARNPSEDARGSVEGLAGPVGRSMTSTLLASTATLLLILDLIGTFVFAISGAASGVKHKLDAFGVGVLAFVAGNAGGVTRDLLIGAVPPAAISDWRYVAVSLVAGAVTFLCYPNVKRLQPLVLLFDAAGLALFAVAGTQKALAVGINPFVAALLGMLTGIGGGVLRDLLVNEVPVVLRADLYALAALAGAAVVVAGHLAHWPATATTFGGAVLCFAIRLAAIRRGWSLPAARLPVSS